MSKHGLNIGVEKNNTKNLLPFARNARKVHRLRSEAFRRGPPHDLRRLAAGPNAAHMPLTRRPGCRDGAAAAGQSAIISAWRTITSACLMLAISTSRPL